MKQLKIKLKKKKFFLFFCWSSYFTRITNNQTAETDMDCCLQAVTVKEALAARGRHLRRSISTPNVQHVKSTSLTGLYSCGI